MTRKHRKICMYLLIFLNIVIMAIIITKVVTAATAEKVVVTLTPDAVNNKIKLDWTMNNTTNKTYKIYQKKPGSSEF